MEIVDSKRLDHHGIVAGVISDLGLADLINERLPSNGDMKVSNGEATIAMIINGLGFTSRPLSLTPQFFSNQAMDLLFGECIQADDFNRHRLGRCLDRIHQYGCDALFAEIAARVCRAEEVEERFSSLDTTSLKVTGEYDVESDAHTITLTHGYSKDHRPDLKQVVLELLVSQDGGIPLMAKSFDGNASDSKIFKERCKNLLQQFQASPSPRYLVADSKLYSQGNAEYLSGIPFITRIPRSQKEKEAVSLALRTAEWNRLDENNKYFLHHCTHYGMKQRWLVIYSKAAHERSKKTIKRQAEKEYKATKLAMKHLKNTVFNCEKDVQSAVERLKKQLKFNKLSDVQIISKAHYTARGRPKADDLPEYFTYAPSAKVERDEAKTLKWLDQKSCYVIGTNADDKLSNEEAIAAYKKQNTSIERGFRFLKDPYFFASSFFIKKPSRIMALLTIMTLSLLVYSVAQRRLRKSLAEKKTTLPNQINIPTEKPTLRWVFQMLEGINVIYIRVNSTIERIFTGLDEVRRKIIALFSEKVRAIYGLC